MNFNAGISPRLALYPRYQGECLMCFREWEVRVRAAVEGVGLKSGIATFDAVESQSWFARF